MGMASSAGKQYRLVHFIVKGDVQGVNFRYNAQKQGRSLKLTGWCHNHPDGSVEGVAASAESSRIDEFKSYLSKGTPPARVSSVEYPFDGSVGEDQLKQALRGVHSTAYNALSYDRFHGVD